MTRKYPKEKERNISDQAKTNPKSFWKYVNQKRKHKVPIPNLYKSKAENKKDLAETDIDRAETLVNQFSSTFTKEPKTNWAYLILSRQKITCQLYLVKILY